MEEFAKKLINDHKIPIVKVDLAGAKLFLKAVKPEEFELIKNQQNNLVNLLSHERVERRSSRSKALWLSEKKLAIVQKNVKTLHLNNLGYQDKTGVFLYPEEMLFLLETNRLEVIHNGVSVSVNEGYRLLANSDCSLTKYRIYKKLALLGYKLHRHSEILRRNRKLTIKTDEIQKLKNTVINCISKKRVVEDLQDTKDSKKLCMESIISKTETRPIKNESKVNVKFEYVQELFEKLRRNAPTDYKSTIVNEVPDFCAFLPNNKSRCDYDFSLYLCKEPIINRSYYEMSPSMFAICSNDNIGFYKFSTVKLPVL